jgi:DNA-binding XRE family transcriptional regulator
LNVKIIIDYLSKFKQSRINYEVYFIIYRRFLLQFRWVKNVRNENIIKVLGERVRELRNSKKLSMEKLAELSGIDYRQLSYIELGQTDPSLSTLYALCSGLGISLAELMDTVTIG